MKMLTNPKHFKPYTIAVILTRMRADHILSTLLISLYPHLIGSHCCRLHIYNRRTIHIEYKSQQQRQRGKSLCYWCILLFWATWRVASLHRYFYHLFVYYSGSINNSYQTKWYKIIKMTKWKREYCFIEWLYLSWRRETLMCILKFLCSLAMEQNQKKWVRHISRYL